MPHVGLVVEGQVDRAVAEHVLAARGVVVDPHRVIVTRGKSQFDARLQKYNEAARHGGWLALRDSDHDAGDCATALRQSLLSSAQSPALCLRLAVRSVESWLLADASAFAAHFAVPVTKVPVDPDGLPDPKRALVDACRSSRRRDVRNGIAPPVGTSGPGPEYTSFLTGYCREAWRPEAAVESSASLARALHEIDRLVAEGTWPA